MGKKQRNPSAKPKKKKVWWRLPEGYSFIPVAQIAVAVSVVLLAVIMYLNMQSSLRYLDPDDSDTLKEAFFGRRPWVVLCNNGTSAVDLNFEGVSRRMQKDLDFGVLDCSAQLASKKPTTTLKRLKLNRKQSPVMFYSAYGMKPMQLSPKLLKSEYELTRKLRSLGKVHAAKVKDTKQLQEACLSKPLCAVVLADGDLSLDAVQTLNTLSDESAEDGMIWAVVDASRLKISNPSEKQLGLGKFEEGKNRVIVFTQQKDDDTGDRTGKGMLTGRPHLGRFNTDAVTAFLRREKGDSVEVERSGVKLTKRPRTSKVSKSGRSDAQEKHKPKQTEAQPPVLTEGELREKETQRLAREAQRRAEMDEESSDFIMDTFEEGEYDDMDEDEEIEEEDEYEVLD